METNRPAPVIEVSDIFLTDDDVIVSSSAAVKQDIENTVLMKGEVFTALSGKTDDEDIWEPFKKRTKVLILIFGILSIVLSVFILPGFIFGGISYKLVEEYYYYDNPSSKMVNSGKRLSVIGLLLSFCPGLFFLFRFFISGTLF